jgi:hypothetical protein
MRHTLLSPHPSRTARINFARRVLALCDQQKKGPYVSQIDEVPPLERVVTRIDLETSIALTCNTAGAAQNLPPIAWRLGDAWDGVNLIGDANAYAPDRRREIVESWIAALGLADEIDTVIEPLQQEGSDMVWTSTMDGITFQLTYPAAFSD